jgi:hypothetical protein
MSIQSYIENLRAKPEHVRRRHAFWYSLSATVVVFVFWLASFGIVSDKAKGTVAQVVEKVDTPAGSMLAAVGDFFVDIKDIVLGPKKVIYSNVEATPGGR